MGRGGAAVGEDVVVFLALITCPSGPERVVVVGELELGNLDRTSAKVMAEMSWITEYPGDDPSWKICIMGDTAPSLF